MNIANCQHTMTNTAGDCLDCGAAVLRTEARPCGDCASYFVMEQTNRTFCVQHMMAVTWHNHVTFHVDRGTCWRPRMT